MTSAQTKDFILTNIEWTGENVDKLLACESLEDFQTSFPGRNIETLKRRQREFRQAMPDLVKTFKEDVPDADGSLSLAGDSGEINSGTVDAPITDWSDTLQIWGLDPEKFEVLEPVTMKAWDTGTGRKFSYRARIQKKTETPEANFNLAGWQDTISRFAYDVKQVPQYEQGLTYTILVADPQLGKPGTDDAVQSWVLGIEGHLDRINALSETGMPIDQIALVFMGDEHEGAVGNYASQPYEIELNYSDQLILDFDMRMWSIRQLLEAGLPIQVGSVPSNHGEHTRFGSAKVLTSQYDNSSTMIAYLVSKAFQGTEADNLLTWNIANDRQDVSLDLSGITANFTHGHIAKGGSGSITGGLRSKGAVEKQILGRAPELIDTTLFFTAHYHHFNMLEDRGRTFFGCPALEAEKSSDWFYSQYGVWSKPGMLGMLVGSAIGERGWGELAVI